MQVVLFNFKALSNLTMTSAHLPFIYRKLEGLLVGHLSRFVVVLVEAIVLNRIGLIFGRNACSFRQIGGEEPRRAEKPRHPDGDG